MPTEKMMMVVYCKNRDEVTGWLSADLYLNF